MDAVALKGLERVVSVTIGGSSVAESAAAQAEMEAAVSGKGKAPAAVDSLLGGSKQKGSGGDYEEDKSLPVVHFRTYSIIMKRSGVPTPLIELAPHGPHFTFSMRRTQQPSSEMWKAALKKSVKKSTAGPKKNKNIDVSFCAELESRSHLI